MAGIFILTTTTNDSKSLDIFCETQIEGILGSWIDVTWSVSDNRRILADFDNIARLSTDHYVTHSLGFPIT